ncbi:hypothetical protein EVAR_53366_1 [Eumeta japonica]|uniref:Uncharacterized protein n=1 Tax=Eumeta variegata TaxID=151549 RepID=A0A4C1Y5B0_EUMVA|nr:hypothetical protein EVAR_53366_1 [Eumeta japonica]
MGVPSSRAGTTDITGAVEWCGAAGGRRVAGGSGRNGRWAARDVNVEGGNTASDWRKEARRYRIWDRGSIDKTERRLARRQSPSFRPRERLPSRWRCS